MRAAPGPGWGFHRLAEPHAHRLVRDARISRGDLVIDVGAGHGALTRPLLAAGAKVIAVELHPARAAALRSSFSGEAVTVVQADACDLRLPRRPFHVVANPPFAVSTALLRRLLSPGSRLVTAHLLLPAPMADRWTTARAPGFGRWGSTFTASVQGTVPRSAFSPPVAARVVVLRVERRQVALRASRSARW